MEQMVTVYLLGKKYSVPATLTIMRPCGQPFVQALQPMQLKISG